MDNTQTFVTPQTNNLSTDFLEASQAMTEEELKKTLNIPERNKEDYPDISPEVQMKAGTFLYKLNLLASGADGNLQSLVWDFYDKLDDYIHLDKENASIELAKSIEYLKNYISEHDNILFHDLKPNK